MPAADKTGNTDDCSRSVSRRAHDPTLIELSGQDRGKSPTLDGMGRGKAVAAMPESSATLRLIWPRALSSHLEYLGNDFRVDQCPYANPSGILQPPVIRHLPH